MLQEHEFKIQVPEARKRFRTVGKCQVDLSKYVDSPKHTITVPMRVSGGGDNAQLSFVVSCVSVKGLQTDDGESMVSSASSEISEIGSSNEVMQYDSEMISGDVADTGDIVIEEREESSVMNSNYPDPMPPLIEGSAENFEDEEQLVMKDDLDKSDAKLEMAEKEALDAKAMLEESLSLLEDEAAARKQAEESVEALEREIDWLEKKALKERADWESRMRDSLRYASFLDDACHASTTVHNEKMEILYLESLRIYVLPSMTDEDYYCSKMEETVMLTSKVQEEKQEVENQLELVEKENQRLLNLVDEMHVQEIVKEAEEKARLEAKEEANIEISLLRRKIEQMTQKLEAAEAKKFSPKIIQRRPSNSDNQSGENESKLSALTFEMQYIKMENESLRQDIAASAASAERSIECVLRWMRGC